MPAIDVQRQRQLPSADLSFSRRHTDTIRRSQDRNPKGPAIFAPPNVACPQPDNAAGVPEAGLSKQSHDARLPDGATILDHTATISAESASNWQPEAPPLPSFLPAEVLLTYRGNPRVSPDRAPVKAWKPSVGQTWPRSNLLTRARWSCQQSKLQKVLP